MAVGKMKGPVGDPDAKRPNGLPPAQNNPRDVATLRELLSVNGYGKPSKSGKVDKALLHQIKLAEIHMGGGRDKDQVIDPDDTVYKYLVKGYQRKKKEEKEKIYQITFKNKAYYLTEKQYADKKAEILKMCGRLARAFRREYEGNREVWKEYNDVARMEKGIIRASIFGVSSVLGGVVSINYKKIAVQGTAVSAFDAAVKSKDLAKVQDTMPAAEKATREAYVEVQRFLSQIIKGSGRGATSMTITSSTCFAIVGAMAAPVIATGAALTAGQAAIAAGTGVAFVESSSGQLGKLIAGEKMTVKQTFKEVLVDTVVGGLTAGMGTKVPSKFVDTFAGKFAKSVAQRVPGLTNTTAKAFLEKALSELSGEAVKTAAEEATKMCGEYVKSGKKPGAKDFQAAFMGYLFKGTLGVGLKKLEKVELRVGAVTKNKLSDQMVPQALEKYLGNKKLPNATRIKVMKGAVSKFNEGMAKIAFNGAVSSSGLNDGVGSILTKAEKYLSADPSLQKKVDLYVKQALKEEGVEG